MQCNGDMYNASASSVQKSMAHNSTEADMLLYNSRVHIIADMPNQLQVING